MKKDIFLKRLEYIVDRAQANEYQNYLELTNTITTLYNDIVMTIHTEKKFNPFKEIKKNQEEEYLNNKTKKGKTNEYFI